MKKNFIVILVIQIVLMGLFLIYAFVQKLQADEQRINAEKAQMEAVKQRRFAEEQVDSLTIEINRLKEELKNCR